MSECMTIADVFAAEEKYSDDGLKTAKDIVQSILTDALHSVVVNTDSNRIGDCNVGEEVLQEVGLLPVNRAESAPEQIGESFQEKKNEEEKSKEYRVIKEQALEDSKLRIENGKIHLQPNGVNGAVLANLSNLAEKCQAKEVNKSQSCVFGDSDKKVDSSSENVLVIKSGQEKPEESSMQEEDKKEKEEGEEKEGEEKAGDKGGEDSAYERSFTPFTTEDLRKSILEVWKNVNSPVLNGWKGEMVNQPQEVVRLMEELATIQVTPNADQNGQADFLEERVGKQMAKEPDEASFESSREAANVAGNEGMAKAEEKTGSGVEEGKPEDDDEVVVMEIVSSKSAAQFQSERFNQAFDLDTKEDMLEASLTESDEAFIESSESVIQIIEPQEDIIDDSDDGNGITFSLIGEIDKDGDSVMEDGEYRRQYEDEDRQEEDETFQRFRSGMTTVGPVKSLNCDPKLLTGPEIDYGRVTMISGSRELTKETAEGCLPPSSSRKIVLDEIDETQMIFIENGYVEIDTIVNHDIASLTKMQKVREVLSDQQKSDEDLRGDDKLLKSPLDLKDVDADSCGSYNGIDISIPLMTAEETNRSNVSKDPGEAIPNVSNFRNAEDSNSKDKLEADNGKVDDHPIMSSSFSCNKSLTQVTTGQNQKHNTIGRVFQKASNRFITKDSDSFLRNSRSLPRDTSKITNTESFRSLLDDCQTSAATVLKKSRSLLRNTQNAFKAVSKTGFGHVVSGDKQSNPVDKSDSRQSTSSKKNEFIKFKDSIKNKVGKTLRSLENVKSSMEAIDQSENQKKLSPKSPLVCPNQLPRKKSSGNRKLECEGSLTMLNKCDSFDHQQGNQIFDSNEGNENVDKEIEVICGVKFQGSQRLAGSNGFSALQDDANDASSGSADYAVVESGRDVSAIQTDEENAERPKSATGGVTETGKRMEAKKSLTLPVEAARDIHLGNDGLHKSLSNGKLARKNKKLSARIRSFWQTAFGKVKATAQKKDVT